MAYSEINKKIGFSRKLTFSLVLLLFLCGWHEYRFSMLQSGLLAKYSADLKTHIEPGPSDAIIFPSSGPFNDQRGYSLIPNMYKPLNEQGFIIKEQSHFSPALLTLTTHQIPAPYRESDVAGLSITDYDGKTIYDATSNLRRFHHYAEIPELIIKTLLFIEDRGLSHPKDVRNNPVINWPRFYRASFLYIANQLGMNFHQEGGSTLATQLEKFRFSPNGRTNSAFDKFIQIASASLKVYQTGTDTTIARQNIILDYLNSVPIAAVPGFGEIHGLPQALYLWFGLEIDDVTRHLQQHHSSPEKAQTFKKILTILCAIRAPSYYLSKNTEALERRTMQYVSLLQYAGIIDSAFAEQLRHTKIFLRPDTITINPIPKPLKKALNSIRVNLMKSLDLPSFYELNRLALQVETSIDSQMQQKSMNILQNLSYSDYLHKHGLKSHRLLARGDPEKLIYSLLLYEMTPFGNELRVHADTNPSPFDINTNMKLDLGSTAKLRTLVHYLEIMYILYQDLAFFQKNDLHNPAGTPTDPLSRWAKSTLQQQKNISLSEFLKLAIARKYSASPYETFFTGGGAHRFINFDPRDNSRRISIRDATVRSVNLVFIRLMRDLVKFHTARLPYVKNSLLKNIEHPLRQQFLEASVDEESRIYLKKFFYQYKDLSREAIVKKLLAKYKFKNRAYTILFFSWRQQHSTEADLALWLENNAISVSEQQLTKLNQSYNKSFLTLSDYAYLLKKHPLELWVAGRLAQQPGMGWQQILHDSDAVRHKTNRWLFKTRNIKAQNRRLLIKIERDAFVQMSTFWRNTGYPFQKLVPSLATAIGTSADRPDALAELMGIIANDGYRRPKVLIKKLKMAENTPYHTVFQRQQLQGEQVIAAPVAKIIRETLKGTVENGTARRIRGAFRLANNRPAEVGGKTGSGDNRIKKFGKYNQLISSTAINRTATFVFFIADRYFGVITAHVNGPDSGNYGFTSSLPVAILKLIAPMLNATMLQEVRPKDNRPLQLFSASKQLKHDT